jgi:uncharacterized protein YjiK
VQEGLLVVDETLRKISLIDLKQEKPIKNITIPYNGARNKGYEAFGFNPDKKVYWLITEKQPCMLTILDQSFSKLNEIQFDWMSEVSSLSYYKGNWFLLSEEERTVYKVSDEGLLLSTWKVNVHNPEGIAFSNAGECLILSDDMATIYFFDQIL